MWLQAETVCVRPWPDCIVIYSLYLLSGFGPGLVWSLHSQTFWWVMSLLLQCSSRPSSTCTQSQGVTATPVYDLCCVWKEQTPAQTLAKHIVDAVWGNSFNTGLFLNVFKSDACVRLTFRSITFQIQISDKAPMCPVGFHIYAPTLCLHIFLFSPLVSCIAEISWLKLMFYEKMF